MNREQIYREMKEAFGLVPGFFKLVPDTTLELPPFQPGDPFASASLCGNEEGRT